MAKDKLPKDAIFQIIGLTGLQYLTILVPIGLFLAIMLGSALYAGQVVNPEARKLKEQIRAAGGSDETLEARFKSLHSMSVKLNSAVLVMGLGILWITAIHLGM